MYIFSLFKKIFRISNFPILIYLLINWALIMGLIYVFFFTEIENGWLYALAASGGVYLISLIVALSPIGEWMVRVQTGCYKDRDSTKELMPYAQSVFNEVEARARQLDPRLPKKIHLFIVDDASPNAFATGRRTVCVTTGMLNVRVEGIKGAMAHELGHLSHHDTDLILLVSVGNLFVNLVVMGFKGMILAFYYIFCAIGWMCAIIWDNANGLIINSVAALCKWLTFIFVNFLVWLWTLLGTLLCMKTSREVEFEADEFAYNIGYGPYLANLLRLLDDPSVERPKLGLLANLAASHPDTKLRIERLREIDQKRKTNHNV